MTCPNKATSKDVSSIGDEIGDAATWRAFNRVCKFQSPYIVAEAQALRDEQKQAAEDAAEAAEKGELF